MYVPLFLRGLHKALASASAADFSIQPDHTGVVVGGRLPDREHLAVVAEPEIATELACFIRRNCAPGFHESAEAPAAVGPFVDRDRADRMIALHVRWEDRPGPRCLVTGIAHGE